MRKETLEWLEMKEKIAKRRMEYLKRTEETAIKIKRIETEGIKNLDDMVFYLEMNREALTKMNNEAVSENNQLLYIESTAILRFIDNTLSLIKPDKTECRAETAEEYYGYQ